MSMRNAREQYKPAANSRYAYATGRIRAMEAYLIGPSRLSRYFEARSAEEIGRLLTEDHYPAAPDPELSLNLELINTYKLLESLSPDRMIVDLFFLPRDFHNLKVMLKAFSVYWPRRVSESAFREAMALEQAHENDAGLSADGKAGLTGQAGSELWPAIHGPVTYEQLQPLLQSPSTVDPRALFDALREQKPDAIPTALAQAAAAASHRYLQTYEIGEIEILLDQRQAALMAEMARLTGSAFLTDYLRLRADLLNLGLLLRTRFLGSGADYLEHILLPGGSIAADQLVSCYDEPAAIAGLLEKTPLAALVPAAGDYAAGGDAIARFSLAADNRLVSFVQKARVALRGPEVLVGYLIAREMETRTVRIILTCLKNGISNDKARELARLTYLQV